MNYKATWFDNPVIARKMSWGNRSAIEPNPDYPVGYVPKEGSEPENWFNFAAVKGPDGVKNIQAMFKNHRQAIGEPDKLGQRHINPDSEVGRTSIIGLEIELLNYIKGQTLSPDFNLNILDQELELIQKTFTGINSKGETVELFDFSKIIEDTKGYFSGSVPDQVKLDVEMAENALIAKQKRKFDDAAAAYEADMNKSISVIKQYVSGSVSPGEAVRKLVNAGPQAVNQVRQALMTTKNADGVPFSKDQADSLLADLAIEFMEGNIFPSTRRFDVNPRNPNQLIPQFDFDMGTMSEILGVNDPNKAIAMKNIIGEKRYNIALKILDFAKNKESSPLGGLSISGIPRSFSMESYISRFYAINRDVIGPQYVATESILQRFRLKNFSIIQAALTDPIVGELFLEMLTSGKLLPPAKEKDLQLRLVAVYSKLSSTLERDDAISIDDVRGLPGWKIRKLTEDPYKGGMFPLYPEFKLEEMVRKVPVSPPMPTTESPFVRRN